jgi:hypothetical protein
MFKSVFLLISAIAVSNALLCSAARSGLISLSQRCVDLTLEPPFIHGRNRLLPDKREHVSGDLDTRRKALPALRCSRGQSLS